MGMPVPKPTPRASLIIVELSCCAVALSVLKLKEAVAVNPLVSLVWVACSKNRAEAVVDKYSVPLALVVVCDVEGVVIADVVLALCRPNAETGFERPESVFATSETLAGSTVMLKLRLGK